MQAEAKRKGKDGGGLLWPTLIRLWWGGMLIQAGWVCAEIAARCVSTSVNNPVMAVSAFVCAMRSSKVAMKVTCSKPGHPHVSPALQS